MHVETNSPPEPDVDQGLNESCADRLNRPDHIQPKLWRSYTYAERNAIQRVHERRLGFAYDPENSKRIVCIEKNRCHGKVGAGAPVRVTGMNKPWELLFRLERLIPAGATALISVQESTDGFVKDIRTLAVFDELGQGKVKSVDASVRSVQRPSARIGQPGVQLRTFVQALTPDARASVTLLLIGPNRRSEIH